jgi:hemerythrin-like domain-containing protein
MSDRIFKLDMAMMYAVHNALRRELERIARITARPEDDPAHILRTAVGWELFTRYLRVHHVSEDEAVWPVMEQALAARPDDLELLHAMEAEHAAIDPMLEAVDAALADRETGPQRLGGLVDELTHVVTSHLTHEENEALALIDATLTPEQWKHFSDVHRANVGTDAPRYLPWLLDSASAESVATILGRMPEPLVNAYRDEWKKAYAELDLWGAKDEPAAI